MRTLYFESEALILVVCENEFQTTSHITGLRKNIHFCVCISSFHKIFPRSEVSSKPGLNVLLNRNYGELETFHWFENRQNLSLFCILLLFPETTICFVNHRTCSSCTDYITKWLQFFKLIDAAPWKLMCYFTVIMQKTKCFNLLINVGFVPQIFGNKLLPDLAIKCKSKSESSPKHCFPQNKK